MPKPTETVATRIPVEVAQRLRQEAAREGVTLSWLLRRIVVGREGLQPTVRVRDVDGELHAGGK